MDGQLPLTISADGKEITILYGSGPIAEKMDAWNYVLSDGSDLPRQLTDTSGEITLSIRYNPWGKTIETTGVENFDMSYISTLVDFSTGLIYVGNGQYFDPETGRFLTRGANPNSPNPYVPWNPITLMLGPLGLVSIQFSRKKLKATTVAGFWSVVLVACWQIAVLVSVALLIGACSPANTPTDTPSGPTQPPIPNGGTSEPTSTVPPIETPGTPSCGGNCTPPEPTPTPDPSEDWDGIARVIFYEGASSFSSGLAQEVFRRTAWALYTIKRDIYKNNTYSAIVRGDEGTGETFSARGYFNEDEWYPPEYKDIAYRILTDQRVLEPMLPEYQERTVHFISPQHFARKVGVGNLRQGFQTDQYNEFDKCRYDKDKSEEGQIYCNLPDLRVRPQVLTHDIDTLTEERFLDLGVLGPYASSNQYNAHVQYQQSAYYHECYWIGLIFVEEEKWNTVYYFPIPNGPEFPSSDEQAEQFLCPG